MTDKSFYQSAAEEVEAGNIDKALWLKITAEYPDATEIVQRARYLQFRAAELASDGRRAAAGEWAKSNRIVGWMPTDLGEWIRYGFVALIVGFMVSGVGGGIAFLLVLVAAVAAPFVFKGAVKEPPSQPINWLDWAFVLVLALGLGGVALLTDSAGYQGRPPEFVMGLLLGNAGMIAVPTVVWALVTAFRRSKGAITLCLVSGLLYIAIRFIATVAMR